MYYFQLICPAVVHMELMFALNCECSCTISCVTPEGAFQRLEKQSESLDSLLKYASCIMGNTGSSVFVI